MKRELLIPAFVFKPGYTQNTTKEVIKRQDDILEIEFPIFEKDEVLKIAEKLALKKRRAHDRPIDDVLEIIDQVGDLWRDPNSHYLKEALDILPMMTGQSRKLCEIEFMGTLSLWQKKIAEAQLFGEIGGKQYLEEWIPKGDVRIHAQPRGLILHNMAGNAFNLGMLTIFYGLITKNVNLIKLSHGEPYIATRFCESIAEVDKKLPKEIAALYWKGSNSAIYRELFNSGYIDCILAWGGIDSIEEIRKMAYYYGIKIIDHGPKLSFSVISEDIFKKAQDMQEIAQKIAVDVICWNQRACLSPRIIYIVDTPQKSVTFESFIEDSQNGSETHKNSNKDIFNLNFLENSLFNSTLEESNGSEIATMMQRSLKLLRNECSEASPIGFARMLAKGLENTDKFLPLGNLTHADGLNMAKKREYFFMNYVTKKKATIFTPPKDNLDWTVVYLRDLPNMKEIDMCQDRFVIVSRISKIQDLIHSIRKEKLKHYLQTVSIYGSDEFIRYVAEELALIGAYRFPRIGEHNIQPVGVPWDGHYVLQDMIKWVYLGYVKQIDPNDKKEKISLIPKEEF
ncbi:MAG: acyl-CoA reductase [Promethearchaeota archaeon]